MGLSRIVVILAFVLSVFTVFAAESPPPVEEGVAFAQSALEPLCLDLPEPQAAGGIAACSITCGTHAWCDQWCGAGWGQCSEEPCGVPKKKYCSCLET